MVEQKKLKLEDAVMLDKNRIIHEVAKNKNFNKYQQNIYNKID